MVLFYSHFCYFFFELYNNILLYLLSDLLLHLLLMSMETYTDMVKLKESEKEREISDNE